MTTPNHATEMQQLAPGLWGCNDEDAVAEAIAEIGASQALLDFCNDYPGEDVHIEWDEKDGRHYVILQHEDYGLEAWHFCVTDPNQTLADLLVRYNAQTTNQLH